MSWSKDVVRRTMQGAGEYPGVQLQLLLTHLERCPEALPAIADAVSDMGEWLKSQAEALEAETRRRNGGAEIVNLQK